MRNRQAVGQPLANVIQIERREDLALFEVGAPCDVHSDAIVITIQPNEGFELHFDVKAPADDMKLTTVPFDFRYAEEFRELPDAYETLIEDVVLGDQTLFVRADEVETAWSLYQPILDTPPMPERYAAGTWGPSSSQKLPTGTGDAWWEDVRT